MLTFNATPDFEPCPVGNHLAQIVQVINLGLHTNNFGTQQKKLRLTFELNVPRDDGKNFIIGETLTASIHPKSKLHKYLMQLGHPAFKDGDTFDPHKLLGRFCYVTVTHNHVAQADGSTKVYANIGALLPPKGGEDFVTHNELLTEEDALMLSEYWQNQIKIGAINEQAAKSNVKLPACKPVEQGTAAAELNDELPPGW